MRKHKTVTIEAEGRDRGKSFLVVEKSAYEAERWAAKALSALSRAGVEVPDEALSAGALGILAIGLDAFKQVPFSDVEPLMDDMLGCIAFVPDPGKLDPGSDRPITRPVMRGDDINDGDIAEVPTLLKLRSEVLELHLGFSIAAVLSSLGAAVVLNRRNASTSRKPAPRSSRQAKPG
jgi:hypothetical protein